MLPLSHGFRHGKNVKFRCHLERDWDVSRKSRATHRNVIFTDLYPLSRAQWHHNYDSKASHWISFHYNSECYNVRPLFCGRRESDVKRRKQDIRDELMLQHYVMADTEVSTTPRGYQIKSKWDLEHHLEDNKALSTLVTTTRFANYPKQLKPSSKKIRRRDDIWVDPKITSIRPPASSPPFPLLLSPHRLNETHPHLFYALPYDPLIRPLFVLALHLFFFSLLFSFLLSILSAGWFFHGRSICEKIRYFDTTFDNS